MMLKSMDILCMIPAFIGRQCALAVGVSARAIRSKYGAIRSVGAIPRTLVLSQVSARAIRSKYGAIRSVGAIPRTLVLSQVSARAIRSKYGAIRSRYPK